MADFVNCNRNESTGFDFGTLLRALFAEEQNLALAETGQYAMRIMDMTASVDRDSAVISCNTEDDFRMLFHRSIGLADDGKPALRVVITDREDGASLEDVPNCTDHEDLDQFLRNAFIMLDDDEVAFNLANIT